MQFSDSFCLWIEAHTSRTNSIFLKVKLKEKKIRTSLIHSFELSKRIEKKEKHKAKMDRNKNSPRGGAYTRRSNYYPNYSRKHPDFFSKKRMICDCKLEFLDAGAYEKHMKSKHPEQNPTK